MADFATVDDIASTWRPLTEQEREAAGGLLPLGSAVIRHRFPSIDSRIDAGHLDPNLVKLVLVQMVIRVLRNPEGLRVMSLGAYSETRESSPDHLGLHLTDDEVAVLAPRSRAGGFGSIPLTPGLGL